MNCLKGLCPLNTEYVCILADFVMCVCSVSSHSTGFESDVGGGKRHTELVCSEDFLEAFIKRELSRLLLSHLAFSLTPFLSTALFLVPGGVNRNWQANAWEHSIALLFFDVCTDTRSRLFLWKTCPECSSWRREHKCLCFESNGNVKLTIIC